MYEYYAKLKRVIDGDTIDAYIDLGFNVSKSIRIRLKGIDTPESRTRDLTEKRYGLGAKHRMIELLESNDNEFVIQSHGVGKYGRCLGEIFIPEIGYKAVDMVKELTSDMMISINQRLIQEGHAIPYFGGSKAGVKEALISARHLSKLYVEKHIKPLD
jgi:micrococcal nuclease